MTASRHPYTYAADFTRKHATITGPGMGVTGKPRRKLGRSEASDLNREVAESVGIPFQRFCSILSHSYQSENFGEIAYRDGSTALSGIDVSFEKIRRSVKRTEAGGSMTTDQVHDISTVFKDLIDMQCDSGVTLTREQAEALPDLVSLALIGYGLIKSDKSANEASSENISPFMSLVQKELDQRSAAIREASDLKYGFHRKDDEEEPASP